jgi:hypothetical protein
MEIAAIVFVIFIIAVAVVTFFILKKAIKMAVRAAIVFLILIIGIIGAASLWYFGSDSKTNKTPAASNKKSR